MPIYFIRSKLKTQFRLVELKRLQSGSGIVQLSLRGDVRSFFLYDLTESKGTLVRPAGIGVDMHIGAADIQTAMKYAKNVANEFVTVSGFAMQTEGVSLTLLKPDGCGYIIGSNH